MEMLEQCIEEYRSIVVLEEAAANGGLGQAIGNFLVTHNYRGKFDSFSIPDDFIHHGNRKQLLADIGLTTENLKEFMKGQTLPKRTFLQKITFRKGVSADIPSRIANGTQQKHLLK